MIKWYQYGINNYEEYEKLVECINFKGFCCLSGFCYLSGIE